MTDGFAIHVCYDTIDCSGPHFLLDRSPPSRLNRASPFPGQNGCFMMGAWNRLPPTRPDRSGPAHRMACAVCAGEQNFAEKRTGAVWQNQEKAGGRFQRYDKLDILTSNLD